MNCNCNVRFLKEGTDELNAEYENMITNKTGDYFYITCSCGNWEEYFHKNFICCSNCKKHYCEKCSPDLVYDIQNKNNIFCCDKGTNYQRCYGHYYCELCVLPDCYKCDDEDKNNCPICCKRLRWKDKPICETHHEIKVILNE